MTKSSDIGLPPAEWVKFFEQAGVREEEFRTCKSKQAKASKIGLYLGPLVGRRVRVEDRNRAGWAMLGCKECRGRQKRYYFEVCWDNKESLNADEQATATNGADEPNGGPLRPPTPSVPAKTNPSEDALVIKADSYPGATTLPSGDVGNREEW